MKKIIGLFVLLLLATNVFSQDYFDKESVILRYPNGNIENQFDDYYYGFITNNKKYVLAYDADVDKSEWEHDSYAKNPFRSRELILYRFDDNKWLKASNLAQTDYRTFETHIDYGTHTSSSQSVSYIKYRGLGNGMIRVLDNECVVMFITNRYQKPDKIHTYSQETKQYTCCDGHKDGYIRNPRYDYNSIIIFVPNGDKTYIATRFEPENKRTNYPELVVNELLKLTESENEIKIDIWNKEICEPEEADSSIIHTYESGRTKEVFYKKKHFTTLRFDIYGTRVRYSGEYDLIKTVKSNEVPDKAELIEKKVVKNNTADNGIGYECLNDDNLSLKEVTELRKQFLEGENQIGYNPYRDHTFEMNFNAPYADNNRSYEPANITNGYQRRYFINSDDVYIQRKVENDIVTEVTYFHPDGRIYNITKIVDEKKHGRVKFVDLENYVILEGEYRNGKLVGFWDTPVLGNFNTQDH